MRFPDFPLDDEALEAPVSFHFEDVSLDLDLSGIADWLLSIAAEENHPFVEVNYIFCSDEYLHKLNVEHLQHDYYTDVITFPYQDDVVHGDIFISTERVADNATQLGIPFFHELCRVMAHGVLHLAGYRDETDEEEMTMRQKENFYLAKLDLLR